MLLPERCLCVTSLLIAKLCIAQSVLLITQEVYPIYLLMVEKEKVLSQVIFFVKMETFYVYLTSEKLVGKGNSFWTIWAMKEHLKVIEMQKSPCLGHIVPTLLFPICI